uniref:Uncharacterized protein n=1 Tax=Siphoviridae sp. ctZF426 TaxID=2827580 RepID=A0A8S5RSS1_9CAUD|nr:MAG TPA: hypothetical protein [Siphoviridae sp. ctZF426]
MVAGPHRLARPAPAPAPRGRKCDITARGYD